MKDIDDLLKQSKKRKSGNGNSESELDEKLSDMKTSRKEKSLQKRAKSQGLPYIDLTKFPISPEALRLISEKQARKDRLICFFATEKQARLASPKAGSKEIQKKVKEFSEKHNLISKVYLISDKNFKKALKRYEALPKIREQRKQINISPEDFEQFKKEVESFKDLPEKIKDISTSKLLTLIMASAVESKASDVHFEAEENSIQLRFRIDGVLMDVAEISKDKWKHIASRIKLLSGMKLNVTDEPQDGHFVIKLPDERIDIRSSALPTSYGESLVMRLLESSSVRINFENLGLRSSALNKLEKEVRRPNGMILTTGPTGSGKTTTLYAILNKLNNQETKIITLENPVEYHLKGINQSEVNEDEGYDFATGLKSLLRQDPDVVMVGEIRDLETAKIALQAALTGHVVVSTLHTNDASGAIPRLLSLGVKPYLLGPAINAIIGQRLVRKICDNCKKEVDLKPKQLKRVKKILSELPDSEKSKIDLNNLHFYTGEGCDKCQGLGYKGRIGIFEIFDVNKEIEQSISDEKISEGEVEDLTKEQGMVTMVQDGLIKATKGITSVEEVFRVIE